MQWFSYFVFSFILSAGINFLFIKIAKSNKRTQLKRFGGVGVILSFLLVFFLEQEVVITQPIAAILIGSALILLFGLWDDLKNLDWKKQLVFQVLIAMMIVFFGFQIDYLSNPFGGVTTLHWWQVTISQHHIQVLSGLIILIWVLSLMNAVNWSDGIDGLSGGIGMLGLLAIFLVSLRPEVNQPAVAIISLIATGSVFGFWWFNVSNGKIEAGSSGSYFIGFILATLAIMAGTKIATTMIILALPLVDALWVIAERMREGRSIFSKDNQQRHLHYRLRNIGWSDRSILAFYFSFLGSMLIISLYIEQRLFRVLWLSVEIAVAIMIVFLAHREEKLLLKSK